MNAEGVHRAPPAPIVVVLPSDWTAAALISSGALDVLGGHYPLHFLLGSEVGRAPDGPSTRVEPRSSRTHWRRALDFYFWCAALFVHLRERGLSDETSFKAMQLPRWYRAIYRLLALPGLRDIVGFVDRRVIFRRDTALSAFLERTRPRMVIIPGSAMDSYSHWVERACKPLGIPVLMIVSHWDYFSKKGLLRIAPDRIYVWGEDMLELAAGRGHVARSRLRILGAPQFDKYREPVEGRRQAARQRFGLRPSSKVVLFAGTGVPFDELETLKRLDETNRGGLGDVVLLYRPHPRGYERRRSGTFSAEELPSVVIDDPNAAGATSDEHYLDLMAAADGIVSPFSTMIVEAAMCGRPSLCIAYADSVNEWNLAEATSNDHIRMIEGRIWFTTCSDPRRLPEQYRQFVSDLDRDGRTSAVRHDIRRTVFYNGASYAERLFQAVTEDFFDR